MSDFFVHPLGVCESKNVGPRSRVWAFAHVLPGAQLGADCNICDHVFIENDVRVGDRVTVKCGVQLWDGVVLEDDVFVGPNATFTNDPRPRSKQYPEKFAKTVVRRGASVGANATILPGITIGENAMIGAGAVVTRDVPADAVVRGNPARVAGERARADVAPGIHPTAAVDSTAKIGERCVVGAQAVLEKGVTLGGGTRISAAAVLLAGVTTGPDVEVGAAAVVEAGVSLGATARVSAGAVVTRNVPPGAIVSGNPAVITGYADSPRVDLLPVREPTTEAVAASAVKGVTIHRLQLVRDIRGGMTVGEFEQTVPFRPQRYYAIFDVPTSEVRGAHAHRQCHSFLVCMHGACSVVVDDGVHREEILLDAPTIGLYRPPMTWSTQYKYTRDAVLLVFASHHYDAADYIRDYDEFLAEVTRR